MITVVRLAANFLCCRIAIRKLNNIMIYWLTNPQLSILPNKWWFNTSQDWEVLGDDFNSISLEIILNATLQTLIFYHPPLSYLEKRASQFVEVTNKLELAIEPEDNG